MIGPLYFDLITYSYMTRDDICLEKERTNEWTQTGNKARLFFVCPNAIMSFHPVLPIPPLPKKKVGRI